MTEKKRFSIKNLFRAKTPPPADRKVWQMGIQERSDSIYMTTPILYSVANQSVIVRTCTTQLKNEIFRRGYDWHPSFASKCEECGKEHSNTVDECSECKGHNLRKPDRKQLEC